MTDLGTVSRREWRRVMLIASAVILLTTIPYVVGWLSQSDGWTFGGFLFGADDGYSYLAKMRLGARGDWLFTIRYTHEPHGGALLFFPYILLGKLTAVFVDPHSPDLMTGMAIMFHLARIGCDFVLILVCYRFAAVFLRRSASRMLALVLIAFGGGLGWLLSMIGLGHLFDSLPVDLYVPEGYSFLILFGLPHLALARSALLLGFLLLFRALLISGSPRAWMRWSTLAGLCWLVMGLSVPLYFAVLYVILGSWGAAVWLRRRRFPWALFWRAGSAALVTLPLFLYTSAVFLTNDVMGQWSGQNRLPSPHPLHYVFGYAALVIPAAGALRWAWRKGDSERRLPYLLLAAWVIVTPFAVYLPVNAQRRLAEGVIVPLSILAVAGLRLTFPARRKQKIARNVMLILALPTALLLWLGGLFSATTADRPLFQPEDELALMDQLNALAPRDSVVLSLKDTGNVLPARTDLKAYVGHGPETLDSEDKEKLAEQFFAGELDADARRALLANADYVFFGPLEAEQAGDDRAWAAGLIPLIDADPYHVYEVPHDD